MTKRKPLIFCADDVPVNIKMLEVMLARNGYDVITADNGRTALSMISERKPDIALLDVMMPEVDGFEICRNMKNDEHLRNIPVVLITALSSTQDRVKGIESGADDFITKPFDRGEVLARVKMLSKMKDLNDRLHNSHQMIADLVTFGRESIMKFDPLQFDYLSRIDAMVMSLMRDSPNLEGRPEVVIAGIPDEYNSWQWYSYEADSDRLRKTVAALDLRKRLTLPEKGVFSSFFVNEEEIENSELREFVALLRARGLSVVNIVCFLNTEFCLFALNYGNDISQYEADVLNSVVAQSLFLKSLASQVRRTESAFEYTVYALARASEANDEDTGTHILRVGEYCAILAKRLGLPEKFINTIRVQATLHDVGKIKVPPHILGKRGGLTDSEWEIMKLHTVHGATIIGEHSVFGMARNIALTHHERWDGSGYPARLKGERIPIEGRILNIADQYDALRSERPYKAAFDHATTVKIITEGDGRTNPDHFDPQVLDAFKHMTWLFDETYAKLNG
jgi:response regulator RpfG family c-di-GMP phosphodiesterase